MRGSGPHCVGAVDGICPSCGTSAGGGVGYTDGLQRRHSMFVRLVEERNALGLAIFGYGIAKLLKLLGR